MQLWINIAAALSLGLLLRLWFISHAARVDGDTLIYGDIARNWLQRGIYGFGLNGGVPHPTLIRLPGYPLFLGLCFSIFGWQNYTAVMFVQAVIDLLTCLLLAALAARLFGRRPALIALWGAALCPFTAGYVSAPLSETLTLLCIALAFYAFHRWSLASQRMNLWLLPLTFALAYALLLRPEQGLLAAAILPAMLWNSLKPSGRPAETGSTSTLLRPKALLPVLLVLIGALLPLAPWTLRNWRTFHVLQPLAPRYATDPGEDIPLGFQRWYRTWAIDFASTENVYWNYDGSPIEISDLPTRTFDSNDQYARTAALLEDYDTTANATPALDARFNALASERIHADPLRYYLALPIARVLNMALRPRTELLPIDLEWWRWHSHPGQTLFSLAYAALNLGYLALGLYGLYRWHRSGWMTRNGPQASLALAMAATLGLRALLLLTLDNSEPRYTLEFFPILILCAAAIFFQSPRLSADPPSSACPS